VKRRLLIFAALLTTLGGSAALLATSASATPNHAHVKSAALTNNGIEICAYYYSGGIKPTSPCFNAWNGGELVKSFSPGTTNEEFELYNIVGTGNWQIYDATSGECVGDYQNNQYDAKAGDLERCPSYGNAGWGTVLQYVNPNGQCAYGGDYYDNHWGGYINANATSGSQFYLNNKGTIYCYYPFGTYGAKGALVPIRNARPPVRINDPRVTAITGTPPTSR
jgi:hypothetical protein